MNGQCLFLDPSPLCGGLGAFALPCVSHAAGAGICARRRTHFLLLRQKKVSQEKATPRSATLRWRSGQPASARLRRVPRNSLRAGALRSDSRGKSVHEACALRRACARRKHPAAGAAQGDGRPYTGHRCARPRVPGSRSRFQLPSGRAEKRSARGGCAPQDARLRELTCRVCPNGVPAGHAVSYAARPAREHRRLPVAQRRDTDSRVAFLLGTFLWRSKEKNLARRGETRLRCIRTDVIAKAHCGVQGHTRDAT